MQEEIKGINDVFLNYDFFFFFYELNLFFIRV